MSVRSWLPVAWVLPVLVGTGCKDPGPVAYRGGVQVSFATHQPAVAPGIVVPASPQGDTIRSSGNTLVINRAEIVLRQIELERADGTECDDDLDGCEEVAVGPLLVDLPLGGATEQRLTVEVPEGTYDEVEFEIHKLTLDRPDSVLRQQRPDLVDQSIRVEGTFNGTPFVYQSDLDAELELEVNPPLVVSPARETNLTLRVPLAAWFRNASGELVDPASANKGGPNESIVKNNIQQSLEAFEDQDRDGEED